MSETGPDSTGRTEEAKQAELDAIAEIDELCWLMSNRRGRRFMWRLLSAAGIYQLSYAPGSDAMATAFREGNRAGGLRLVALVTKHCPERFSEMQKESRSHDRSNVDRKAS
jgi:hypothetical protein